MHRKLIISCIIIVLLAAYGLFGIDYMKQCKTREALASAITNVTQELKQVPAPPQNLEQRLAAAQASLAAARSAFPGKPNSTQIINRILKLADECQVKAIPLATQEWSSEKIGKGYLVFRIQMTVQGNFARFVDFLNKLENEEFETLAIENLRVTRPIRKTDENAANDQASPIIASLDVAIYARVMTSE